ncbi:hypothetical protein ACC697_38385, partial [Rhizobium ruizarguesonis]
RGPDCSGDCCEANALELLDLLCQTGVNKLLKNITAINSLCCVGIDRDTEILNCLNHFSVGRPWQNTFV